MEKDHWIGIAIILGIIAIGLFGGAKNSQNNTQNNNSGVLSPASHAEEASNQTHTKVDATRSSYQGLVHLRYITHSNNPDQEYLTIQVDGGATNILVTGWTLTSTNTGTSITMPKGTYLLFTNSQNSEDNMYLSSGDTMYLITGHSPNGESFKTNKCSGYMTQFQTYTPYLQTSCPLARNENLSNIPTYATNDACFDYIDSYPACKTQTDPLPVTWSSECKNFIQTKLTYASCVDTHKSDKDFYKPEWRVYLGRSQTLWKDSREHIVLYDNNGKIVDTLTY